MSQRTLLLLLKSAIDSMKSLLHFNVCVETDEGISIDGEVVKVAPEVREHGRYIARRIVEEVLMNDLRHVRYVPLPLLVLVGISMIGYAYPRCAMYLDIKKVLKEKNARIIEVGGMEWIDTSTLPRDEERSSRRSSCGRGGA